MKFGIANDWKIVEKLAEEFALTIDEITFSSDDVSVLYSTMVLFQCSSSQELQRSLNANL